MVTAARGARAVTIVPRSTMSTSAHSSGLRIGVVLDQHRDQLGKLLGGANHAPMRARMRGGPSHLASVVAGRR